MQYPLAAQNWAWIGCPTPVAAPASSVTVANAQRGLTLAVCGRVGAGQAAGAALAGRAGRLGVGQRAAGRPGAAAAGLCARVGAALSRQADVDCGGGDGRGTWGGLVAWRVGGSPTGLDAAQASRTSRTAAANASRRPLVAPARTVAVVSAVGAGLLRGIAAGAGSARLLRQRHGAAGRPRALCANRAARAALAGRADRCGAGAHKGRVWSACERQWRAGCQTCPQPWFPTLRPEPGCSRWQRRRRECQNVPQSRVAPPTSSQPQVERAHSCSRCSRQSPQRIPCPWGTPGTRAGGSSGCRPARTCQRGMRRRTPPRRSCQRSRC